MNEADSLIESMNSWDFLFGISGEGRNNTTL